MEQAQDIKERLILATTVLIQESGGAVGTITTRAIAKKAGVGVGLVNYHFQTKDHLIEVSVERIIRRVVTTFQPGREYADDKERLAAWAMQVFDFLFQNEAVSRISILGDMADYTPRTNSAGTQRGFLTALRGPMPEEKKRLLTFTLTSAMQAAFLSWRASRDIQGIGLEDKEKRDHWIQDLVNLLWDGIDTRMEDEV